MPFDWFTMVAQILNFLVLVWILKRVFYRPVLKAMAERQERVQNTIREAAEEKDRAGREREALKQARSEFAQKQENLLEDAQQEARTEGQRLLEEARREMEGARVRWREALAREQDEFRNEWITQARAAVLAIAKKVLTDLADSDLEDRVVKKFLTLVQGLDSEDRRRWQTSLKGSSSQAVTIRSAFDLGPAARPLVEQALRPILGDGASLHFETKPSMGCGIELSVDGQKVAWTIEEYLRSLNHSIRDLLAREIQSHDKAKENAGAHGS